MNKKASVWACCIVFAALFGIGIAANLSYNTNVPQTGDSELVIAHKQACAIAAIELAQSGAATALGTNTTALGTNSTATGTNTTALGTNTTALGTNTTALGTLTTALTAGNSYKNIATAATTTVKSGAGFLDCISINTAGTGTTVTVYDNTAGSGTKIGTFTSTAQGTVTIRAHFGTGLTVVTDAGSALADITVSYQ